MIKPIKNKVLVKPHGNNNMTDSGLIIPDDKSKDKKIETGVTIAVGPNVFDVTVNSTVYFGKYIGTPVTMDGEKYLMMKEDEIDAFSF